MEEIWKDIEGYEGMYQVSSIGNVRSVDRWVKCKNHYCFRKGCMLKKQLTMYGYYDVNLYKDGTLKRVHVHRLVAIAFIPNPNNYPCVNHKSEVKTENSVENLEWCSYTYNSNYGTGIERSVIGRLNGKQSKKVLQYDMDGTIINEWPSVREIQRSLGFAKQNISACCLGKHETAYGFKWRYAS